MMASSHLIKDIDAATQILQHSPASQGQENARLLASAKRLVASLESEEDQAWRIVVAPNTLAALMALMRMGLFKVFTKQKMTATEISVATGADHALVVRLMRALLVSNIFEQVGDEEYEKNALSEVFADGTFQTFLLGMVVIDTRITRLADFLESINFRDPLEPDHGLLQYVENPSLPTMEWFKAHPKEMGLINDTMVAQTTKWRSSSLYALSSLFPQDFESDVLIVDVGGGRGDVLEDLRAHRPDLKGRMIFQDLPEVFAGQKEIAGVEAMAHDFLTPQPIKGANVYRLSHVLHDWPDVVNRKILANIIAVMGPHSRIVIQEQVISARGASPFNVKSDISMMLFTGMERSEKQWRELLDSVGLQVTEITPPDPNLKELAYDSTIQAVPKQRTADSN